MLFPAFSPDEVVLTQDSESLTLAELESLSFKVASYVADRFKDETVVGVRSDNAILGLPLALGVALAGKHFIPQATVNDGNVNGFISSVSGCKAFIGYGTDFDHSDKSLLDNLSEYREAEKFGSFAQLSSGSVTANNGVTGPGSPAVAGGNYTKGGPNIFVKRGDGS